MPTSKILPSNEDAATTPEKGKAGSGISRIWDNYGMLVVLPYCFWGARFLCPISQVLSI